MVRHISDSGSHAQIRGQEVHKETTQTESRRVLYLLCLESVLSESRLEHRLSGRLWEIHQRGGVRIDQHCLPATQRRTRRLQFDLRDPVLHYKHRLHLADCVPHSHFQRDRVRQGGERHKGRGSCQVTVDDERGGINTKQ